MNIETLALQYPVLAKVPATLFDAVTSRGISSLNRPLVQQFRKPAGWFGRMVGRLMMCEHSPVTNWAIGHLSPAPADRVLDVGCGAGAALRLLARRVPEGLVFGVDYSPTMVDQARRHNHALLAEGRCSIRQADVVNLPYPDNTFDKAITIETLYFWPAVEDGLAELYRVLKPGGRLAVVLEYTRDANDAAQMTLLEEQTAVRVYSRTEVAGLMERAGFSLTKVEMPAGGKWLYLEGRKPERSTASRTSAPASS